MLPVHKLHLRVWFLRGYRASGFSWLTGVVLQGTISQMDSQTLAYYSKNASHLATRYDEIVSNLSLKFETAFHPNSKILDIGCGSGRDLSVLHRMGHNCYGVEPTPEFVALAQQAHPELKGKIAYGVLPKLSPLFDGEFNGVLCAAVLMHIAVVDLDISATAIKNCLKIGGRLLYSVSTKRLDVLENDRDANGRLFVPNQSLRLIDLFEKLGFIALNTWTDADSFGGNQSEWVSVLMERKI